MAITSLLSRASATDAPDGFALLKVKGGMYIPAALSGNVTLDATYPAMCKFDAGGSNRDITLDTIATAEGLMRWIVNSSTGATNLVVKNPAGSTIGTLNQNEEGIFFCDGSAWYLFRIATIALS